MVLGENAQEHAHIGLAAVLPDGGQDGAQQSEHLLSFVQKEALVAFGLSQGEGCSKTGGGMKQALLSKSCARHERQALHFTTCPPHLVRLDLPAFEQAEGLRGLPLRDEQAGNDEVFLFLVQPWQAHPLWSACRGPVLCCREVSCRKREPGLYCLDAPLELRQVGRRPCRHPSKQHTEPLPGGCGLSPRLLDRR